MATVNELLDALYDWVEVIVPGREIVHDHQDARRPGGKFVMIRLAEIRPLANDVRTVADDGAETLRNQCEVTIDIGTFGGFDAQQDAMRLSASTKSSGIYDQVRRILGRGGVQAVRDLTGPENGAVRERHEFRMTGYIALSETFSADYFDSTTIIVNETDRGEVTRFTVPDPST